MEHWRVQRELPSTLTILINSWITNNLSLYSIQFELFVIDVIEHEAPFIRKIPSDCTFPDCKGDNVECSVDHALDISALMCPNPARDQNSSFLTMKMESESTFCHYKFNGKKLV